MKERPILFSGPMVRALLEGRKTQTRRIVKLPSGAREVRYWAPPSGRSQPGYADPGVNYWNDCGNHLDCCPYGQPGDRLWVRERVELTTDGCDPGAMAIHYLADGSTCDIGTIDSDCPGLVDWINGRWSRPSIHMPRWASRITLEITGVRVERLQDISEEDAHAEGARECDPATGREVIFAGASQRGSFILHYRELWEEINGPVSWDADPWVWRVEFRRVVP